MLQLHTTRGVNSMVHHDGCLSKWQSSCCLLQMAGVTRNGSDLERMLAAQQFLLQHCKVCNHPNPSLLQSLPSDRFLYKPLHPSDSHSIPGDTVHTCHITGKAACSSIVTHSQVGLILHQRQRGSPMKPSPCQA